MWGSFVFYLGLLLGAAGCAMLPARFRRERDRSRAGAVIVAGLLLSAVALLLPAAESSADRRATHLDELMPVWQFSELHSIRVDAPPERVYEAIRRVRADEIFLFRTLTWIRRGGRELPPGILNAGKDGSLIDVATANGFVRLVDQAPRELVVGTVIIAPPGSDSGVTPDDFRRQPPPGYALATMNFTVTADDRGGSIVWTETRVFAGSAGPRRRFAAYWRIIYPGSALIRRMWLRAIERRATGRVDETFLATAVVPYAMSWSPSPSTSTMCELVE